MTEPVHIMLVDDHPLVRDGLRARLEAVPHFRVVAEADSGAEALALAGGTRIDLVLMDITMRDGSGIEATARLTTNFPDIAVLILSMHDKLEYVTQAMQAGARGYVLKSADPGTVLAAIRSVAHGEAIFGAALAQRLSAWFSALPGGRGPFVQLTPREHEALELIARGWGNPAIAQRMSVSPKTVRNLVSNIFSKLQVADRAEAIAKAREAGLGGP